MYIVNLMLTGDAYALIKRNGNGEVLSLHNVPSKNVELHKNSVTGETVYGIKLKNDSETIWLLHA